MTLTFACLKVQLNLKCMKNKVILLSSRPKRQEECLCDCHLPWQILENCQIGKQRHDDSVMLGEVCLQLNATQVNMVDLQGTVLVRTPKGKMIKMHHQHQMQQQMTKEENLMQEDEQELTDQVRMQRERLGELKSSKQQDDQARICDNTGLEEQLMVEQTTTEQQNVKARHRLPQHLPHAVSGASTCVQTSESDCQKCHHSMSSLLAGFCEHRGKMESATEESRCLAAAFAHTAAPLPPISSSKLQQIVNVEIHPFAPQTQMMFCPSSLPSCPAILVCCIVGESNNSQHDRKTQRRHRGVSCGRCAAIC